MYKIHKTPMKMWPVVSDCVSLTHPLGKWINIMLQTFAKAVPAYPKDSFELKEMLLQKRVPPGARLFTSDAKSMYTNIDTDIALARIAAYLRLDSTEQKFHHYSPEALIAAPKIAMHKIIFRFGDIGDCDGHPLCPGLGRSHSGTRRAGRHRFHLRASTSPLSRRYIDNVSDNV
ncbi:hypothetical protein ACHAWF_006335 [Thalassiosira exigua]